MNEKDMCGRFVFVRAYLKSPEREAELSVWKHNRFRWFDRMKVHEQINDRVINPWRIDQGYSSLCGMASLYYVMIKRDPKIYEKMAKELFRIGEYEIANYVIKPHEKALSMYETKPADSNYKSMRMHEIDWIVLATTRSKESLNSQFVYNGFENGDIDMIKAVNWPDMLTRMCKEVAGFKNAESCDLGLLQIANKKGSSGRFNDYIGNMDLLNIKIIEEKHKKGNIILMMIDSSMIDDIAGYNSKDLTTDSHWVVYEGGLTFFDIHGNVTVKLEEVEKLTFRIFTWGRNPKTAIYEDFILNKDVVDKQVLKFITPKGINIKSFKSNYYGYIEVF